jgi:hypothetical protein
MAPEAGCAGEAERAGGLAITASIITVIRGSFVTAAIGSSMSLG